MDAKAIKHGDQMVHVTRALTAAQEVREIPWNILSWRGVCAHGVDEQDLLGKNVDRGAETGCNQMGKWKPTMACSRHRAIVGRNQNPGMVAESAVRGWASLPQKGRTKVKNHGVIALQALKRNGFVAAPASSKRGLDICISESYPMDD